MVFVADYFKHSGNQSSDMMSQGALLLPLDWQQPNQTAWTYFLATSKQLQYGSMLKSNIFAGSSKHRPKYAFINIYFYHGKRKNKTDLHRNLL